MLCSATPTFHDSRRLLVIGVAILVSSSLLSLSHGVSSSCHNHPSSTSFQGSSSYSPFFFISFDVFYIKKYLILYVFSL